MVAARDVHPGTKWGPYPGILQSEGGTDDQEAEVRGNATTVRQPLAEIMLKVIVTVY